MQTQWIGTLAVLAALAAPSLAHKASQGKLIPDDLAASDEFGFAVDMYRSTAVASAPHHDDTVADSGAVYVFERSGISWLQQAKLLASNAVAGDLFGYSVAIDGDTVVVGAPFVGGGSEDGAVYVFVRTGTTWSEQAILVPSVPAAGDRFGFQVAISGDTLIAGAPNRDSATNDAGGAFIFVRTGTTWSEEGKLRASDAGAGEFFGTSVSLDGDRALIGSIRADGLNADTGAAYLFERTAGNWSEQVKFSELESAAGDLYGSGVSLSGSHITIGSPNHDALGANSGQAFFYKESAGVWTKTLTTFGLAAGDNYGASVDNQSNGYSEIGSAGDDETGANAGKALLYTMLPPPGAFEILISGDPVPDDQLGSSVALSSECWSIVGAPGHDDAGDNAGSADIFALVKNPVHYCTAGTSANGCQATIEATGVPSSTATDGFIMEVTNLEGSKDGLFFYGTNGQQALSWGSSTSFRCVVPPTKRGGLQVGSGTSGLCDGFTAQDLNVRRQQKPGHNPGAGAVVQLQFWYRDPANTSNQTSSLSDAVEIVVCP